jgi:hypothetical protein
MDTHTTEQDLRCEAIRRRLQGERRCDICQDLARSTRWFDKWWGEYCQNPLSDLDDHSRAPHASPQAMPDSVVQAVISVRQRFEAAATSETKYGLIGPRAIRGQLEHLRIVPLPSLPTIQRILAEHSLTHPLGAGSASAYYPWPLAWEVNAIHATDIITRHVRGGEEIQNFHTIDHYSHAVSLSQHTDKTSATTGAHLLAAWSQLGLPHLQQFDNEGSFCGGHTHPHIIGRVVRLCLFCGIEPLFTPFYEANRNYQIETFHSLWDKAFWSRQEFRNRDHVQAEVPAFERWYHTVYQPPSLEGKTPAQMRCGARMVYLTQDLARLIPNGRWPITAGRVHFMRRVDPTGHTELLNERWLVGEKWIGEYVRATINTAEQVLTFWHQAGEQADWRLIKTRQFRLKETVHDLLPQFRRKCARCRDY